TQSAITINNEWKLLIKTSLADVTTQKIHAEFDYLFDRAKYPSEILDEYMQIYQRASKLAKKSIQRISHKIQPNKIHRDAL
ncbi:hypothetical protein NAI52_11630, partial [Francisella tularensis subsp. holarctica]|uniref:hypothetical protein n=1 Tax=Francisella tularensis TaxID=263 RepID=UPI002381A0DF